MKTIGIVGHFMNNSFGITKPYLSFFSHFGEVSLISPYENEIRDLDLLVLPGGPDVWPGRYGQEISPFTQTPCMIRERFDQILLPKYIEAETPIFGICRGHQTLAVQFGAELTQQIWNHETNPDHDRQKLVHKVKVHEAFNLIPGAKANDFEVNSLHHQVVANCPANASILATFDGKSVKHNEEGDIEALVYLPNYPAVTVQWHPEEIYDETSIAAIRYLINLKNQ